MLLAACYLFLFLRILKLHIEAVFLQSVSKTNHHNSPLSYNPDVH